MKLQLHFVALCFQVYFFPHVLGLDPQSDSILSWFLSQEGSSFDSDKQKVILPSSQNEYGVFALETIEAGSILARIPWQLVLEGKESTTPDESHAHFSCTTARRAIEEFSLGNESKWFYFLQHLKNLATLNPLPSLFSPRGKELFLDILGGEASPHILLDNAVYYAFWDWEELCDEDAISAPIALLVKQFGQEGALIPIKDLYRHRNGKYHNVDIKVQPGELVEIVARRNIEKGEELHLSYNNCIGCDLDVDEEIGTPELFRDHGIIEQMPQTWVIPEGTTALPYEDEDGNELLAEMVGLMMKFELNEDENGDIKAFLHFDDIESQLYPFIDALFRLRIQELHHMKNIEFYKNATAYGIPEWEWDAIWKFHESYATALKLATFELHQEIVQQKIPTDDREERFFRNISTWEDHYTDFHVELDHISYNEATCNSSELVDFFSYEKFELERSNYQEMLWQYRAEDNDTCLHLDNMLQICSSYRPHYHEFFVHFPARYLPKIERVIFLGSGDAMLLHEILKYPSLKKVVGLELDQTVTRKSFKHFKTQPHYDDPRVEWWYGDATKTLPLLPRDYWGSFDLLLVDLSETVVSLHVTGQHDVLDVISMLLKPEGVMLENELYIDKMSRHFDNTVHIFYGSPKVCIQVHTVSSNTVDFLRTPIYDHEVDMYLIDKVENDSERHRFIHDYVKTDANDQGKCTTENLITTEHGRKSGIFMVLEAENVQIPLNSEVVEKLRTLLSMEGFTLIPFDSQINKNLVQIPMKEGYIQARLYPSIQYVSFDIHFWGAYSKMETVRSAMVTLLGSTVNSSYRVVTGGMQESNTWYKDQNDIGIQFSPKRNCTRSGTSEFAVDRPKLARIALDESISLLDHSDQPLKEGIVLVACGLQSENGSCEMLEVLNEHPHISEVVPIWACDGIPSFNNGSFSFKEMYQCERDLIERLDALDKRFNMFLIDESAPLSMLQIFISIWGDFELRDEMFQEPYAVVLPAEHSMDHRRRFMDLFRKFGHGVPSTMAEFRFGSNLEHAYDWRVFTVGTPEAVRSIVMMEKNLQSRIPQVEIKAQVIEGGQLHAQRDLELETRAFSPESYDYGPNQLQMQSQRPLGRQTIFQFELQAETYALAAEEISRAFSESLKRMNYASAFNVFDEVGAGILLTNSFEEGSSILVWDGLTHIDINLFCTDESVELANSFGNYFVEEMNGVVQQTLRDDQPRGYGRVVNFQSDIDRDSMAAIKKR